MPAEPDPTTLTAPPGSAKHHFSLDVRFPVYSIAWINDDEVVLAGGGGGSRTGVRNRLSLYSLSLPTRTLTLSASHTLSSTEDAPMTIAYHPPSRTLVAGINSAPEELEQGRNENLRVFEVKEGGMGIGEQGEEEGERILYKRRTGTVRSTDPDQYQKVTAFTRPLPSPSPSTSSSSPSDPLVALGSTNAQLSLVRFPELEEVWPPAWYTASGSAPLPKREGEEKGKGAEEEEVVDVDFDDRGELLVGTSPTRLSVYPTSKSPYLSRAPEPVQVIERPVLKKEMKCVFRAAKFGRRETASHLYTVVNASPLVPSSLNQKQRRAFEKKVPKKAFVSLWDAQSWTLLKTRTVCQKPVTVFEVSEDGERLAYGGSDLSVGVLDARTLRPILTILHAHDFPVTSLKFNPSGTVLISGSADNSVRIIKVPAQGKERPSGATTTTYALLLTLLILLVAIAVQMGVGEEVWRAARGAGL
ncbi:hypothetical protein JCM8097_006815 [Rhodosporidiobolus ruineniae]